MRQILHIDMNNFYASVETKQDPSLNDKVVAVCGDATKRHGVVLAKNQKAKMLGIKTGMTIYEAQNLAPDLVVVTARFKLYMSISKKVKQIFSRFTDKVESYGIDEAWLDVTNSTSLFGSATNIARKIKELIKEETGLTVSIGVSYNKIYAKLGSDIAGVDEIIEITESNKQTLVYPLPVENLLYVGKQTKKKLNKINIFTIGDLANTPVKILKSLLGKWGEYLSNFARGTDSSPVRNENDDIPFKSIGNSITNYKDISSDNEIKALITVLCESVASRCREAGVYKFSNVYISIKDCNLSSYGFSKKILPTILVKDLIKECFDLYKQNYKSYAKVRAMGVSVSGFVNKQNEQLSFDQDDSYDKQNKLEQTAIKIRNKHGNTKLIRAVVLSDKNLASLDIKNDHTIHPESYFK